MAVIDLYRATGDEQLPASREAFVRVRDDFDEGGDDNQDRIPVREQTAVAGHAVRANYLYAGLADLVAETGDGELSSVLEKLWRDVVDTKLYITGGCGALYDGASPDGYPWQGEISRVHQAYGRAYQLPNTTAHAESCANIGMILWGERMLALTGDAGVRRRHRADRLQQPAREHQPRGLGVLLHERPPPGARPAVSAPPAGRHRPAPVAPAAALRRASAPALSQLLLLPAEHRADARALPRARGLALGRRAFVHLYGGSDLDVTDADGRRLALSEDGDYPWGETLTFTVTAAERGGIPLHLRIPGWSADADAHRQRRARAGERTRHLHPHRPGLERR